MSDRKYRQRGYREDDRGSRDEGGSREPSAERPRQPRPPGKPAGNKTDREPRAVNIPVFHQTMKCSRCGAEIAGYSAPDALCTKCGTALHSCVQCASFDPGSRFECMQQIPERIATKDA